jgi:hypothetical protein
MLLRSCAFASGRRATPISIVGTMHVKFTRYRSMSSTARAASKRSINTMGQSWSNGL